MARLVLAYKAAVLSFQLVLKMAEIQYEFLTKVSHITATQRLTLFQSYLVVYLFVYLFQHEPDEESEKTRRLKQILETTQKEFCQWKDNLLQKPLFQSDPLTYPKEIEVQQ